MGQSDNERFAQELDCEIRDAAFEHVVGEWIGDYRDIAGSLRKRARELRKVVVTLEAIGPPQNATLNGPVAPYPTRMESEEVVRNTHWRDRDGIRDAIEKILSEAIWADGTAGKLDQRRNTRGRRSLQDKPWFKVVRRLTRILERYGFEVIPGDEKNERQTKYHKAAVLFASAVSDHLKQIAETQEGHGYLIHIADDIEGFTHMSHRARVELLRRARDAVEREIAARQNRSDSP